MTRWRVVIAVVLLAVSGLIAVLAMHSYTWVPLELSDQPSLKEIRAAWSSQIRTLGPQGAYQEFRDYYNEHPLNAHLAAHVMGDLLYEHEGSDGLKICDDSFGSGCYHEIMGKAVSAEGVSVLPTLATKCETVFSSRNNPCVHGMGHGVMTYFGYRDIAGSIAACHSISTTTSYAVRACVSGALMEYFIPVNIETGTIDTLAHPMDVSHPYDICGTRTIPSEFQEECYNSLPTWWDRQKDMTHAKIGRLCESSPSAHRVSCYKGIGISLPGDMHYDQERILATCNEMPSALGKRTCIDASADTLESFKYDSCSLRKALAQDCVLPGPTAVK